MAGRAKTETAVEVVKITQDTLTVCILGKTPMVCNAMSEKVRQGLLLPRKKNAAEKASTMKHNPPEEYRSSIYRAMDDDAPTRIVFPAVAFKRALADAAKDMPGAAKAQVGRLTYVVGDVVSIYGVPKLWMTVVRSADMARTPDVRTRAIIPEWACTLRLSYVTPILNEKTVGTLLAAAGIMRGIGDGRPEKGWGSYGQFDLVDKTDKRWLAVVKAGGRAAQDAALKDPEPYDSETLSLLDWFRSTSKERGFVKDTAA